MADEEKTSSVLDAASPSNVEAGESVLISKDEQHLANLGYKQGECWSGGMLPIWLLVQKLS